MMFRIIKGWNEEGEIEWGFNWGILFSPFRLILSTLRWMIKKIRYASMWIFYKVVTFVKLLFAAAQLAVVQAGMIILMVLILRPTFYLIRLMRF